MTERIVPVSTLAIKESIGADTAISINTAHTIITAYNLSVALPDGVDPGHAKTIENKAGTDITITSLQNFIGTASTNHVIATGTTNTFLWTDDADEGKASVTIGWIASKDPTQPNHLDLLNIGSNSHASLDSHLGSTANPHSVTKAQVGLGDVEDLKINLTATTDPLVTDDVDLGYVVGSRWYNVTGDREFVCLDNTDGVAIWIQTTKFDSGTGVISGGNLTINGADDTKFDISNGNGIINNPTTGFNTLVSWSGLTAQSTTYTGLSTFVSINSSGGVVYSSTEPTNSSIRDNIFLGTLYHANATNITAAISEQATILNPSNQIRDFMEAVGYINVSGNAMSSNSLLTVAKAVGVMMKFGSNFDNDIKDPHNTTIPAIDTNVADTFRYIYQDGSLGSAGISSVIPGEYDDGNGSGAPGTVTANRWTTQRFYVLPTGELRAQPGQFLYNSSQEAKSAISTEAFVTNVDVAEIAMHISYLVLRGNATDLSIITDAEFISAGKFAGTISGGASGGTAFNDLYLEYQSSDFLNPNNADWTVNDLAASVADTTNSALSVRRFDASTEEGIGFQIRIPASKTQFELRMIWRAETTGAGNIVPKLYFRRISNESAAPAAWTSHTLDTISGHSDVNFHQDNQTILFTSTTPNIVAGELYQFEYTRDASNVGDNLAVDWNLLSMVVEVT